MDDVMSRQAKPGETGADRPAGQGSQMAVPLLPEWARQRAYLVAGFEIVLVLVLMVIEAPHGPFEAAVAVASALALQGTLWWAGYTMRGAAAYLRATRADYLMREMAAVDHMDGTAFEEYVVQLLTALGYRDVLRTGGRRLKRCVDITAIAPDGTLVAIECKRLKGKVTASVVQQLAGAVNINPHRGRSAILITSSVTTADAKDLARGGGVKVIERSGLQTLIDSARSEVEKLRLLAQTAADAPGARPPSPATPVGSLAPWKHRTDVAFRLVAAASCWMVIMAALLVVQASGSRARPAAAPASSGAAVDRAVTRPTLATPGQVIRDFYAAISRHDWKAVWQLGGDNLARESGREYGSYRGMISGYQGTVRDVLTTLHVSGATVTGQFLAYQASGLVRTYHFTYVIRDGAIVSGYQR
jgi:hypothetical protein